ncbi:5-deoxy-glucuronate isomerase [Bosea caraganae]|uniref:5-deoxy-glucuronate isomerase n=1 Tax=Bosea caraganae TaxID=2763117 RepID=A0A370L1H9_9HYPH|nr:5-deoxy-glucuronate isomerase [Bosea caraganae]RDJ21410.1 5-deoxy-glucuronate isomerase [Bosea caraganae]RDJ23378.1 5-deoxy-glucuronate isomerase [Bosea caraganae]
MSKLLIKPSAPDRDGRIHEVTPQTAGWDYVGFEVYRLTEGQELSRDTGSREVCIVLLSGTAAVRSGDREFGEIGGRASPFEPDPWSFYVPARASWSVTARGPCELAVCSAPGQPGLPPRVIAPKDVASATRGQGSNTRHVRNILPETEAAESLLVVEVITPSGNWSSYPPHKHDRDRLPHESQLEETYYHRLSPPQGFALQRVYTDDRSLDETIAAEDGDVVLVPEGYHPVAAPHGYDLYYLNVMAGPKRIWKFVDDPAHAWIVKT